MVVELVKDEFVYVFEPEVTEKVSPATNPAELPADPVMGVLTVAGRIVV